MGGGVMSLSRFLSRRLLLSGSPIVPSSVPYLSRPEREPVPQSVPVLSRWQSEWDGTDRPPLKGLSCPASEPSRHEPVFDLESRSQALFDLFGRCLGIVAARLAGWPRPSLEALSATACATTCRPGGIAERQWGAWQRTTDPPHARLRRAGDVSRHHSEAWP
jgi:hypothetical protein